MELYKENIYSSALKSDSVMEVLTEGDTIVPDTKPDIAQILSVDGRAVIDRQDIQPDRIVFTGTAQFTVLYRPEGEQAVKSLTAKIPFNHIADIDGVKPDTTCRVFCDVSHTQCELLNSRKVSIKSVVSIRFKAYDTSAVSLCTDISGGTLELLRKNVKTSFVGACDKSEFSVTDRVELPAGQPSILELLSCSVTIIDKDVKIVTGKAVVKGALRVCQLYTGDDGTLQFMEHEIPFTEVIDASGLREDMICDVDLRVTSAYSQIAEDMDGEPRMTDVTVDIAADIIGFESGSINAVTDCYEPGKLVNITKEECTVTQIIDVRTSQLTLKDSAILDENLPPILQIYMVKAAARVDKTEIKDGRVTISGTLCADICYFTTPEHGTICSFSHNVAFTQSFDCPGGNIGCEVVAEAMHCDYNIVSSNELDIRAIVFIRAMLMAETALDMLSSVEVADAKPSERPSIVIYFVQSGDSLWNIAKRYNTTIDSILQSNKLDEGADLHVGMRLIIPRTA